MAKVLWTPLAEAELDDILYFIAVDDERPMVAENNYFELKKAIQQHLENKLPGQRHPVAPPDWLYFRFKRWLIFYKPHPEGMEVMRIVDGVRDLPRLF